MEPSSTPPVTAAASARTPRPVAPTASSATPHASTAANMPSADTPTHTAPGSSTPNGSAARATSSAPSARSVTATAAQRRCPDQHGHQAGGPAPAEADPVEHHVDQEDARRMGAHVRGPVHRLVGEDVVGERREHVLHAGDPRHVVQVLLTAGEPLDDPSLPAVDQRERQRPHGRGHPRRGEQPPPRQRRRQRRPPSDDRDRGDGGDGRARAHVRQPLREQRGKGQQQVRPAGQQHPAHDRGGHDEHHCRRDRRGVAPGATAGTRLDPDPARTAPDPVSVTGGPPATGRARRRRPAGPRAGRARRGRRRCRRARRRPARRGSARRRPR